jgi:hypothetical protein
LRGKLIVDAGSHLASIYIVRVSRPEMSARNTTDIDLIIKFTLSNLQKIEILLNKMGMASRLPIDAISVYKFRDEYIKKETSLPGISTKKMILLIR